MPVLFALWVVIADLALRFALSETHHVVTALVFLALPAPSTSSLACGEPRRPCPVPWP
ncbi:MAG: hypothetical protein WKG00_41110 [Polyangiaceae bacterium]